MSAPAPWSVKGIDPKAREVAKDLARRSGMTLGEWLNRMILEDETPEDVTSQAHIPQRPSRGYFETSRGGEAAPHRLEAHAHPVDEEVTRVARALERLSARMENAETRTSLAIAGVEHSVREAVARIETSERDQASVAARFEGAVEQVARSQARLSEELKRVEAEGAGPRSAQALRALEQALGKIAGQLYEGEGRAREMIEAVEARVQRLEAGGAGDADRVADEVVGRLATRLAQAEARTGEALAGLRASFASLDGRLKGVEGDGGPGASKRLEGLAMDLTHRVDAVRAEVAERLRSTVDDERLDHMEARLNEMADHVRAAEQRSAQAIERMGQDVMGMADALTQRVQTAEEASAAAIAKVGGDISRVVDSVESRLGRSESVHAEALERLGGEIARITERLGERIGAAERRSAQAIDEVGEQVARVTERLTQRHDRGSEELTERIRQSEERTAKLLEEARERIDHRLAEVRKSEPAPIAPAVAAAADEPLDPASFFARTPFGQIGPAEAGPLDIPPFKPEPYTPPPAAAFPTEDEVGADTPELTAEDFDAADGFAPIPESEPEPEGEGRLEPAAEAHRDPVLYGAEPEPELELDPLDLGSDSEWKTAPALETPAEPEAPAEPTTGPVSEPETSPAPSFTGFGTYHATDRTPEPEPDPLDIWADEAPAAKDSADILAGDAVASASTTDVPAGAEAGDEDGRPLTTREVIERARAAARAAIANGDRKKGTGGGRGPLSSLGLFKPKGGRGSTLQTALFIAGGAAFLSVAAAGLVVMDAEPGGATPKRVADAIGRDKAGEILGPEADTTPFGKTPRAAIALSPQPITSTTGEPALTPAADTQDLARLYGEAVRGIEAREPDALDDLRKTANLGYAPAQLYLAKLYESGEGGLKKDLAEARRWTERAAQGGDRKAMHNLALYYFEGAGSGPKNTVAAAQWFRRAADLGLVDSQYNLGRLYEEGIGVSQNAAEAYKWYLIAAQSGDAESRASAQRVRARLSAAAQGVVERAAGGFRPAQAGGGLAAVGGAASDDVVTAQRALSRLGYYQGPTDGAASPALRMAVAAYQRDQDLAPTGALDAGTVSRLAVFTR